MSHLGSPKHRYIIQLSAQFLILLLDLLLGETMESLEVSPYLMMIWTEDGVIKVFSVARNHPKYATKVQRSIHLSDWKVTNRLEGSFFFKYWKATD